MIQDTDSVIIKEGGGGDEISLKNIPHTLIIPNQSYHIFQCPCTEVTKIFSEAKALKNFMNNDVLHFLFGEFFNDKPIFNSQQTGNTGRSSS